MIVRACCNNCGFVGDHDVPYRARITNAIIEDRNTIEIESAFKTDDGVERDFLCTNCGLPTLEVIYWDSKKLKPEFIGDKLLRVIDG